MVYGEWVATKHLGNIKEEMDGNDDDDNDGDKKENNDKTDVEKNNANDNNENEWKQRPYKHTTSLIFVISYHNLI